MKALSIRQPWAWLIVQGRKTVENRTWHTNHRGLVLVHAAKGMTREEYDVASAFAHYVNPTPIVLPAFDELKRGGIIGSVEITDCVTHSDSAWFSGPNGFVLRNPQPLPFVPLKGKLGFFEVDEMLLQNHG